MDSKKMGQTTAGAGNGNGTGEAIKPDPRQSVKI